MRERYASYPRVQLAHFVLKIRRMCIRTGMRRFFSQFPRRGSNRESQISAGACFVALLPLSDFRVCRARVRLNCRRIVVSRPAEIGVKRSTIGTSGFTRTESERVYPGVAVSILTRGMIRFRRMILASDRLPILSTFHVGKIINSTNRETLVCIFPTRDYI